MIAALLVIQTLLLAIIVVLLWPRQNVAAIPVAPSVEAPPPPISHHASHHAPHEVQILKGGNHLGWRPDGHPDIHEALQKGNDLSVVWPDGRHQETHE